MAPVDAMANQSKLKATLRVGQLATLLVANHAPPDGSVMNKNDHMYFRKPCTTLGLRYKDYINNHAALA